MAAATIVHDTSEAVELCAPCGLYLKPITKMTISVALPQLKQPGKSISNWEVMERLKGMVQTHQFSTLRISKSTMDFIRFEGEVENKSLVKSFLACLDGKTIKLSGFSDILKVRAAEYKIDFPTRHDWDSFFRDAKDMNETLPGERPDTIHLEGLPCKWFAAKDSGSEKPSEEILIKVFRNFGEIRNVDIPMLDPYREEMTGRNFHTFSFGGHLNFEAYVQYQEYAGFIKAMNALRGMKLMYKGDDGKAVACNIKVRNCRLLFWCFFTCNCYLQELEKQREEQKRKEKEAEEKKKEEERKQRELEEYERERKREEKLRKREQKQKDREVRRNKKQLEKLQAEEQKKLQEKIKLEERKLLLAQRNLQSIRLIAELLSRAKTVKLLEQEQNEERICLQQLEERRRLQEAELKRVEEEKERALGLQRKEKELREKLLNNLLSKKMDAINQSKEEAEASQSDVPKTPSGVPHTVSSSCITSTSGQAVTSKLASSSQGDIATSESVNAQCKYLNGNIHDKVNVKEGQKFHTTNSERCSQKRSSGVLSCLPVNNQQQKSLSSSDQNTCRKDSRCEQRKHSTEPRRRKSRSCSSINTDESKGKRERNRHRRDDSYQDEKRRKERRYYRHSSRSYSPRRSHSPRRRSVSPRRSRYRRTRSREHKRDRRERSRSHRSVTRRRRHRRSLSKQRSTWSG
ncbi:AK17A protein, partial [Eolophus roseicapillus]|nr:AK17A protein [Eolophus roseicapilla]